MSSISKFTVALLVVFAAAMAGTRHAHAAAQAITNDDLRSIQDDIDRTSGDVADLRSRDSGRASDLQRQLEQARDDVAYLRVKLRRNEAVSTREYDEVRNRVDDIRRQARGDSSGSDRSRSDSGRTTLPAAEDDTRIASGDELPVGTEFDVRLQTSLSSETARVEDRFDATTAVDLRRADRVLVPAGSIVHGTVSAVTKTTRIERKGSLTLVFDGITVEGRSYPLHATVVQALESEGIKGEAGKIGIGAGVGAIIGGLLGGAKGAIAGILIGGGGTVAATEGKDVALAACTVLRVRLDAPLVVSRTFN